MSRTIRFHKFGAAEVLKCEEHEVAAPAPGEVQVRVEAIAISWYDVLWRQNLAPTQARLPAGIGHEMAGIVTAVGAGVDDLSVGDKVASFPAQSANDYPTYGELILMPRSALTRYPDILTPVQACTHYTPLLIAYFAYVDLARVKPGQSVLITDASHCAGPSFVQLGKALGAKVIAATKESEERNYLLGLGADHVIVTEEQDLLMQINKMSDKPMRNTEVLVAGSNSEARLTAVEMESSAGESRAKISIARAVGSILRPVRTNKGSSNRLRRRERAALIAGCPRKSFSAARVTLRSCIKVSKTISKFRSTRRKSLRFIWQDSLKGQRVVRTDLTGKVDKSSLSRLPFWDRSHHFRGFQP